MEVRLTTTSMNRQAEGKVIKEIDQLKASVPSAERFSAIEPEMKALKAEKNTVWAQIKKIRGEEEVINKEMDKIKEDLAQTNAEKEETHA